MKYDEAVELGLEGNFVTIAQKDGGIEVLDSAPKGVWAIIGFWYPEWPTDDVRVDCDRCGKAIGISLAKGKKYMDQDSRRPVICPDCMGPLGVELEPMSDAEGELYLAALSKRNGKDN